MPGRRGGQARLPALNDPLLMLEGARMEHVRTRNPSLNVGTGPSLRTFNRLDFLVNDFHSVSKLITAVMESKVAKTAKASLRELMSVLVTRSGYSLISPDDAVLGRDALLIFRREGQEAVYLMKLRRLNNAKLTLKIASADSPAPMSNRWLDEWMAANPDAPVVREMGTAREEGRLVKLMGGLKVTSQTDAGTQVFMQRLADDL